MSSMIGNHRTNNTPPNLSYDSANILLVTPAPVARVHMPHQSDISTPTSESDKINYRDALNFVKKVKDQFCDQPNVYTRFLIIVKAFKEISTKPREDHLVELCTAVSEMFRDHEHLMQEFMQFVPHDINLIYTMKNLEIASKNNRSAEVSHLTHKIENLEITSANRHSRNNRSALYYGPGPQRKKTHRRKQKIQEQQ